LIISSEDSEYQFNCYSWKKDDKKVVGASESVTKLNIEGNKDKSKTADGATPSPIFNVDIVSRSNKLSDSPEHPEENQIDSNNSLKTPEKTPEISDEDSYLSDATLCSTASEIDDLDSDKFETHSNLHKISCISGPSLLKVSTNGIFQLRTSSALTSFSKVEVMATINETSKVTWRTLGCPHENQETQSLICDNEKSSQFCHLCLQELLPV
jgi:hypothetical protein